jgi:hypothetical protein
MTTSTVEMSRDKNTLSLLVLIYKKILMKNRNKNKLLFLQNEMVSVT